MEALELTLENVENQNKFEEIGNTFYKGITELYRNVVDGLEGIYDTVMAYGQKDGGRRNANKDPVKVVVQAMVKVVEEAAAKEENKYKNKL